MAVIFSISGGLPAQSVVVPPFSWRVQPAFFSACCFLTTSTRVFTALTEWTTAYFSSASSSISMTFSTPPAPRITGTPT